jgi:hypothetical protein
MWYDENANIYGNINYTINKAYCDKNNIQLFKSNKRRHSNRHPAWERIPLILEHINDYDYIMWIDADAHFYIDSENIINLINDNNNYDFIFSKDISVAINTGCFIVKNTKYSIDFLKKWGYDEELYKNNNYPYWWDNGVILDMFTLNILDIKNKCIIIDYGVLQHFYEDELLPNKPFIFHLAGQSKEIRIKHSLNYKDSIYQVIQDNISLFNIKRMTDESNCSFISSRGFLKCCDIKSSNPISSIKDLINYNFDELTDNCTIYICSSAIYYFMKNYINNINFKFILVSGDDDQCCPRDMFTSREQFLNFIHNDKIIHWFAQNNIKDHPKITKLPIGLDYHTLASDNYSDNNINELQLTPTEQEEIILNIKNNALPFWKREIKCYSNFHFVLENKYCYDRRDAISQIPSDLIFYEPERTTKEEGFLNQSKYSFVVSPHGMGLDCHRTWEALILGCIVIVKTSDLDKLYDDLPVLIVSNWSDINYDLLKNVVDTYKNKIFNYEKLNLKYWMNKINSYKNF